MQSVDWRGRWHWSFSYKTSAGSPRAKTRSFTLKVRRYETRKQATGVRCVFAIGADTRTRDYNYGKPDVANPAIWNKKKKKYRLPKLKLKLCVSTKPLCFCVFNILFSNVCNLMRKGWKLVYTKFLTGANSRPEKSKAVRNTFEIFQNKHVLSQEQCEPTFRLETSRTKQCCSNKKMSVVSFQRAR